MKKYKFLILTVFVCLAMLAVALWLRQRLRVNDTAAFDIGSVLPPSANQSATPSREINAQELAQADGQNDKPCYVAVNGTVYEIKNSPLWQHGQHSTSGGQAMCGKDLSEVIKRSPHGTSKLDQLPKIGTYKP